MLDIKKTIAFFVAIVLALLFLCQGVNARTLDVSASCAILMDAENNTVLFEKNADRIRPMASTTKIMTAIVALDGYDLHSKLNIPKEAVGIEGSSVYLSEGESLTLKELLYALMLSSANDAAIAIAILCEGSVDAFVDKMNDRARSLGLSNTHFENPHGLDGKGHHTTARELAILTAHGLKNPVFREIAGTKRISISLGENKNGRVLTNHNKLLRSYIGAIGIKTGFTKKSGRCLVSAATRDEMTLIAVTLNAPDDWNDHRAMLDYGFDNYEVYDLLNASGEIRLPVISGTESFVTCLPNIKPYCILKKDHGSVICRIELKKFEYAPVAKDQVLGQITYICDGRIICKSELMAVSRVDKSKQKYTIWDKIWTFLVSVFVSKG